MRAPIGKKIKGLLGHVAGRAGIFARGFREKMVIVAFHRVNDARLDDPLTCDSAKFKEFCEFFRSHFNVIPLSEQVAGCSRGRHMGGTLSVTFDDGYRDNFEIAAPILRGLGLPGTFFVTTGFIGTETVAPWDQDLVRQPGWMDWDEVRSLAAQGFEIGCHTDSHIDLGSADEQSARADLELSKRKLHEQLGAPARLFAYPFGGRNNITPRSLELVREAGFVCCLSCYGGVNTRGAGSFDLKRIPVGQGFANPNQFGFDILIDRV